MRALLDVLTGMPRGDGLGGADAVDAAVPEIRALLRTAADLRASGGSYDWVAAEAVAHALTPFFERSPRRGGRDGLVCGAIIGLLIAGGGRDAYGRYVRRFGAIANFLRHGLPSMASSALSERAAFHAASRDGDVPPLRRPEGVIGCSPCLPRATAPLPRIGGNGSDDVVRGEVVTGPTSSGDVEASPMSPMMVDALSIRRVAAGDVVLVDAVDLFRSLGYRDPVESSARFVRRNADLGIARVVQVDGRSRGTFLTVAGVVAMVGQMGPNAPGRAQASRLLARILSRLLPDGSMAVDAGFDAAFRSSERLTEATRRRWAIAEARASRLDAVMGDLSTELADLRLRMEEVEASDLAGRLAVASDEVRVLRAENARLRESLASPARRVEGDEARVRESEALTRRLAAELAAGDALRRERDAAVARADGAEDAARTSEALLGMERCRADDLENRLSWSDRELAERTRNLEEAKSQLKEALLGRRVRPRQGSDPRH